MERDTNKLPHTPGPWKVMPMDNGGFSINMEEALTYMDLSVAGCYGPYEQNEANAKLIAAAPELLEALEFFYANGQCDESYEKALAAIQKAKM